MVRLALFALITLHLVDGRTVEVSPLHITRLSEARDSDDDGKQLHPDVRCIVHLSDGKYVAVAEECSVISKLMEGY